MWNPNTGNARGGTGLPQRISKSAPCSPLKPKRPPRADSFHVVHKVPVGDSPYVRAKHVQLVDKEPDKAIALFWGAINEGDRVDSALKDMAIVMKQQNRPEEAIEAIKSLRNRCSDQAQESLDNVLLDLYKRCGRLDDQISLLKHKLHLIHAGLAFNGKRTKTARSQGKKFQVSVEQEATRLMGNLGWAYMQKADYISAENIYRKALSMEPDNNKMCNLGICLMKQGRIEEAKALLEKVTPACADSRWGADSHLKSYERAQEMLRELQRGSQIPSFDAWEFEDGEDADDTDENANVNIQSHHQDGINAEALRNKLDMLYSNNFNNGSGVNSNHNSPVTKNPAKFSPKPPRPSAARRSLSLDNFDTFGRAQHLSGVPPQVAAPIVVHGQQLHAGVPASDVNRTVVSRSAASSPVKKQLFAESIVHLLPSATALGVELGFIQSPTGVAASNHPSRMASQLQPECSRFQEVSMMNQRLRVFQDITTSSSNFAR